MITDKIKQEIVAALLAQRVNFQGNDTQYAISLGINKSVYNRIKKGDLDKVLNETKWVTLARRVGINLTKSRVWQKADTPIFQYITAQMAKCQKESVCSLFCDVSDIGKTFAAKYYAANNKNVVYVDCSQVKSKQKFIRYIAKEFGIDSTGKYADVYEDLIYYLKTLDKPLIILDEAGDLQYDAFLEIKALYNGTEYQCAFYMLGADGLKAKMIRAIEGKKVGYTEIFSRFGKKYGGMPQKTSEEKQNTLMVTAAMIIKANAKDDTNVKELLRKTMGESTELQTSKGKRTMNDGTPSLRRIYTELSK
jgi:DNA transposition AAA+ family ATPase